MRISHSEILIITRATRIIYAIPTVSDVLGQHYMNVIIHKDKPKEPPIVTYSVGHAPEFFKIKTGTEVRDVSLFSANANISG